MRRPEAGRGCNLKEAVLELGPEVTDLQLRQAHPVVCRDACELLQQRGMEPHGEGRTPKRFR